VPIDGLRLRCEARSIEGRIQKIAGCITGKGTAGAVAPVCTGRKPDKHNPRMRIAKGRNRFAPILVLTIRSTLLCRDGGAICTQLGAALALDNRSFYF